MSNNTTTAVKTQHYGFAVIGDKLRMAEPAATEATALARATKIAEKAGAGKVPTLTVTATSRDEARTAASAAWLDSTVEDATPEEQAGADDTTAEQHVTRAEAAAAKTGPKSGYYTVGRTDGKTVATQHPVRDSDTALSIAFTADDGTVIAVKAKSRDEAINRYDAVADALPESKVISVASRGTGKTREEQAAAKRVPVKPSEGGDTLASWEPSEAPTGLYYVSKSGILHPSADCRFVKADTPTIKVPKTKANLVETILRSRTEENVTLPETADGKIVARHLCASCSGKRRTVEADVA